MKQVLTIAGSRAELVRLAPIIRTLRDDYSGVVATRWIHAADQPDQIWTAGALFGLTPDGELPEPRPDMPPVDRSWALSKGFAQEIDGSRPDLLIVQGDSSAAMLAAQQAFIRRIPIVHVQGPVVATTGGAVGRETVNARMLSALSAFHCVTNSSDASALRSDGYPFYEIGITGDTVVDAVQWLNRRRHPGNGELPEWAHSLGDGQAAKRIGRLIANWSRNRILTPRAFEPFRGDCAVTRAAQGVIRTSQEHFIDF